MMARGTTSRPVVVIRALDARIDDTMRAVTLAVQQNLIILTPVDTGHARGNWVPSIGSPSLGVKGAPGVASTSAQAAGVAGILRYRHKMGATYITNNVPYIRRLNRGHSRQAPPGFVRMAVLRGASDGARGVRARIL